MVGWHHRLNGHEFAQTLGDSEGQGSLVCCSSLGSKESDTTERLNNHNGFGGQFTISLTGQKSRCVPGSIPSGSSRGKVISCLYQLLVAAGAP